MAKFVVSANRSEVNVPMTTPTTVKQNINTTRSSSLKKLNSGIKFNNKTKNHTARYIKARDKNLLFACACKNWTNKIATIT